MTDKDAVWIFDPELAEEYAEWTECVAFRVVQLADGSYEIEATNDLELITRPEESA